MTRLFSMDEVCRRSEAIGLSVNRLAKVAGVSRARIIPGSSNTRVLTLEKLNSAILAEEQRLREHLAQVAREDGTNGEG